MDTATGTPTLDDYQVAHLFVLLGENPLPAYVAARTMLKPGGVLYPVYTTRTAPVLTNLRSSLQELVEDDKIRPVALSDNETDAFYISTQICETVKQIDKANLADRSIGLNYTGGTAPMGVHSYNTIRRMHTDAVFSYLDPRRLEMCVDRTDGERIRRKVSLIMTIDDVIKLHGLQRNQKLSYDRPIMLNAATAMAKLQGQSNKTELENWKTWCGEQLRARAGNQHAQGKDKVKAEKYDDWAPDKDLTLDVATLSPGHKEILSTHFGVRDNTLRLGKKDGDAQQVLGSPREVCRWLDGTWLESYVLGQVKQSGGDINESVRSVRIPRVTAPDQEQFEFDVAFVVGYQLFGISCTTSRDHKTCKLKLLEAYVRVRQLGGDEARTALVCMHTDTAGLKKELALVLPNDKIAVFGRQDLPGLSSKVKAWVDQTRGVTP